jgi:hypothetical protein
MVIIIALCLVGSPALAQQDLQGDGIINDRTPTFEFDLDLSAGDTVTISTEVTTGDLDTTITLFAPDGDEVAYNDDRGDGTYNSLLTYTAESSGTYRIVIGRYDDSTRGEFTVLVQFGELPIEDDSGTSGVGAGGSESLEGEGRLDDVVNSEFYEVDLDRGDTITVRTEATSGDLDTILILRDPNGDIVAENDDRGDGTLNSEIIYITSEGGTYEIEVTRFDETVEGAYIITVDIEGDDAGGMVSAEEAEMLREEGSIDDGNESESWNVELEAGTVIVIDAQQTDGNLDTTLQLIDPNGDIVAENDDRGDGTLNSRIVYSVEDSGTYEIIVSRYDNSTDGDYELIVTLDPNATPDFSFVDVEGDILGQFEGELNEDTELIEYEIDLTAGQSIYATSEATSGDLDTVLRLLSPEGETLAVNDDRGDGTLNSVVGYTVESSGTYILEISRYDGSDSAGEFVLMVQLVDASVVDAIEDTSNQAVSLSGPVQILETDHFRIHYTLAGSDATTEEYVREFAATLEEMYDLQINRIGWYAPPVDERGLYDAYLADVIGTELGALAYARPIDFVGDNPNSPLEERDAAIGILVVDNDYEIEGANVDPQTLMRASTTHEFNHVIQFGYDANEELFWIFEATAVWTETVTVGDEQDATGYIEQNHEYPELCFATEEQGGSLAYGDWTILETLADRHGEQIVLRIWENAIEGDGLEIIETTLAEYGETLPEAVAIWRARNLVMDYDLGGLFPRPVWIENEIDDFGDWTFEGSGVQELGANYFTLDLNGTVEFELDGPNFLDLWVIGINGDEAQAFNLAQGGTVDLSDYDNAYAMVIHMETPGNLGSCDFEDYEILVDNGGGSPVSEPTLIMDASNFQEPR